MVISFVVLHALITFVPGAYISTPGPFSLLLAFCSRPPLCTVLSTLPTISASSSKGELPLL